MSKKPFAAIFAVVFFIVLLADAVVSGAVFMYQKTRLAPAAYSAEDFTLNALVEKEDGVYVTTDTDPYMTIKLDRAVKKVEFSADYYVSPGEIVLFYTKSPEQDFSYANYCIAHTDSDGSYRFDLDGKYVCQIRIDPTSIGGNRINLGEITVNNNITLADYFNLSALTLFRIFALSCVAARAVGMALEYKKD